MLHGFYYVSIPFRGAANGSCCRRGYDHPSVHPFHFLVGPRRSVARVRLGMGFAFYLPAWGLVVYCIIRPPLLQADREEQDLELALKQRELMKYGDCGNCGYPVEADYVLCPNCHTRLKNLCPTCRHALDPAWSVCPYCTTKIR